MCSPVTSTPKRSAQKCKSFDRNVSDITRENAYKTANNGCFEDKMSEPRIEICFQVTPGDPNIAHYLNVLADLQPVLYRGRTNSYYDSQSCQSYDSSKNDCQQHQAIDSCNQAGAVFNVYQSHRSESPSVQPTPGFRIYQDSPQGSVGGRSHAGAGFQIFQDSPDAAISRKGSSKSKPTCGDTVLSAVGIGTAAGAAGRSFRIFEDDSTPNTQGRQIDIQIRHNKQAAASFLGNSVQKRKPFGKKACGQKIHKPYDLPQIYPKCCKRDSIKKTPSRRVTAQGRRLVMNTRSPCSGTKANKSNAKKKPGQCENKITKNPFFNFLRDYRKKNCNKTFIEIAVDGAKEWKTMSLAEKCPYKMMTQQNKTK